MFWVSVVIFFIVGPALIFYADGYRLNVTNRELLETGTLVVSSRPVSATISLDGETLASKSPLTIDSLEPKEYLLTLTSPGYLSWTKHLLVSAGQSTFASDIRLIKDSANKIIQNDVQHLFYDPDTRKGFVTTRLTDTGLTTTYHTTQLLNTLVQANREAIIPVTNASVVKVLSWSTSDNRVIIQTDNRYWLVNYGLGANQTREVTAAIPAGWQTVRWSNRNSDELIISTPDKIVLINLATITQREIDLKIVNQPQLFTDAFSFDTNIYVIASYDNTSTLLATDSSGQSRVIYDIPGSRAKYIGHDNKTLVVKTGDNQLQVHHRTNEGYRLGFTFDQVRDVLYNTTDASLLFTNGNELFTYAIELDSLALLVRQGSPITNIDWFEDSHATYISNNNIYLIERDGRDGHINWQIGSARTLHNYFIPNSWDSVYFVGDIEEGSSLYQREI